ncbi:MAG: hypothetical protein WCA19_08470 [Candidatus Acidiferrales bacterium]
MLRALGRVGHSILSLRMNSFVGLSNNPVGLIAELRGKLASSLFGELPAAFVSSTSFASRSTAARGAAGRAGGGAAVPSRALAFMFLGSKVSFSSGKCLRSNGI